MHGLEYIKTRNFTGVGFKSLEKKDKDIVNDPVLTTSKPKPRKKPKR